MLGLFSHDYAGDFFGRVPQSEWEYLRHPKIELRWDRVEATKGAYDWSGIDAQVKALQANGIDDLLLLINVPIPIWARDSFYGRQAHRAPPVDSEDWRRLVDAVVQRYGEVAGYYEILNEPGWDRDSAAFEKYGSYHFGGQVETDYIPMLEMAYSEIKSLDPSAMVISGAMNCDVSGVPDNGLWLMDLMTDDEHRMQDYCDAFNLHPYYQPDQWGYAYDLMEDLLESKGIDKGICVTEIGWPHASDNDPATFYPRNPVRRHRLQGHRLAGVGRLPEDLGIPGPGRPARQRLRGALLRALRLPGQSHAGLVPVPRLDADLRPHEPAAAFFLGGRGRHPSAISR